MEPILEQALLDFGLRPEAAELVAYGSGLIHRTWRLKTVEGDFILQQVNAALYGQTGGGFVTCCAALLRNDGQLVVANAGHPSPYVDGRDFAVVQIAGLIARRILCDAKEGQALKGGSRFGIIRFGSRTDLYLPAGARLLVAPGQRMIGGETVMAELEAADQTPRAAVEF